MKSSTHQFSNYNSFYLSFLLCTILTSTILGDTNNDSDAVNKDSDAVNNDSDAVNNDNAVNYTATVSTFIISLILFQTCRV